MVRAQNFSLVHWGETGFASYCRGDTILGNPFHRTYLQKPFPALEIAGMTATHPVMSRTLQVIQLNVRKQGEVHDSLTNDVEILDATVVAFRNPKRGGYKDDS